MDSNHSVMTDHCLAVEAIEGAMRRYSASAAPFRSFPVIDPNGNYLLLDEGWDGHKRIHRVWLHVELKDGKFWIHEDSTEEGVANLFLAAGVPKERIVLAFHAPELRSTEGFAAA